MGSTLQEIIKHLKKHVLGMVGLSVLLIFVFVGLYAPFFASSKPFILQYDGQWYFPFFRYLFYSEFYTKPLDIFFNLLMFTLPLFLLIFNYLAKYRKGLSAIFFLLQMSLFLIIVLSKASNPASDLSLVKKRQQALKEGIEASSWNFELQHMNGYARINLLVKEILRKEQNERFKIYEKEYQSKYNQPIPTLWNLNHINQEIEITNLRNVLSNASSSVSQMKNAESKLRYIQDKNEWIENESKHIHYLFMPFLSHFHWEEDAGGSQSLNQIVQWRDLTRINRKDLLAALIFGIRISLSVGIIAVGIALLIGVPIGAFAGYYGGSFDMITSRLLEIWESMPTFFMLLMVVAMLQSKSIFIVITVIGLFGWTSFTRYIRGEFFKQKNLSYVEACHSLGFKDRYIIFSHILPNAIAPVLTLLSFSIMGAITSEAGLSFLGLGEEGSCSWGVLMDEGRSAFPAESYLLWPPAILLTILLIAIALLGDALRDVTDPRLVNN